MAVTDTKSRVLILADRLIVSAGVIALTCMIFEFGFTLDPLSWFWIRRVEFVALALIYVGLITRLFSGKIRATSFLSILEILFVTVVFVWCMLFFYGKVPLTPEAQLMANLGRAYLVLRLIYIAFEGLESSISSGLRPAWILLYSYSALILAGTVLLSLPKALRPDVTPWTFTEALLASTSAVCGLGLSVRDVGSELSFRGQLTIFVLMQIGGLGVVTFVLFSTFLKQRNLQIKQMLALREMMSLDMVGNLGRFLAFILISTFVFELVGAIALYNLGAMSHLPTGERVWWCIFQSVSAFCNNGYSLSKDNLVSFSSSPQILLTVSALIILGGIGFPVLFELARYAILKTGSAFKKSGSQSLNRISTHTRIVLKTTFILLIAGTGLFLASEWYYSLKDFNVGYATLNAFFETTSARTAGFNSLEIGLLRDSTYMLMMLLMLIGAAPVSTGGGIKVTTAAVVFLSIRSFLRNRNSVEVYHRTLPSSSSVISLTLLFLYASLVIFFSTLLMITQSGMNFRNAIFEIMSVMSSVGYSSGAVTTLDDIGRIIFCIAALVGRLGPLTLLLVIMARHDPLRYQYPQENILIS